jgi:hypothetical protein
MVTFPPGLDETRIAVVDQTAVIAEHVWRPADNYRTGPATWDWRRNVLDYDRTSAVAARRARVRLHVQPTDRPVANPR